MQLPFGPPFAHANFQLGRKGQRPKGRKVKGQNFIKVSRSNFDHILSPLHWFHFIFRPKNGHCRRFGGFSPLCMVYFKKRKILSKVVYMGVQKATEKEGTDYHTYPSNQRRRSSLQLYIVLLPEVFQNFISLLFQASFGPLDLKINATMLCYNRLT